ncbi:hypothetical protein DPMN_177608 [Dreissena polymorpha]|uniref:Uncharacterized protein n=1 Tax=Dreissena polymorpha TaxID=45954 RepID=A0A9D4EAJ1_DREPO|nr:hypothetical protein DPMN_177608 [Dreissena polymorpha]
MTKNIRPRNWPAKSTCICSQLELGHCHGCNCATNTTFDQTFNVGIYPQPPDIASS